MDKNTPTVKEIRAQVERAKAEAMQRFARDYGADAPARLVALRKNNAKALEDICRALSAADTV